MQVELFIGDDDGRITFEMRGGGTSMTMRLPPDAATRLAVEVLARVKDLERVSERSPAPVLRLIPGGLEETDDGAARDTHGA